MNRETAIRRVSERWFAFDFYGLIRMLAQSELNLGTTAAIIPFERTYFPIAPIQHIEVRPESSNADDIMLWIFVNIMGLYGTSGCLPNYFDEVIFEEQMEVDRLSDDVDDGMLPGERLRPFLGLLNERIYHYLYRSWASPRLIESDVDDIDNFQRAILALAGLSSRDDYRQLLIPCVTFFAHPTRSPWGLIQLLSTVFSIPARVEEFVAKRIEMDPSSYSLLNQQWAILGSSFILGTGTTVAALFFKVILGPLSLEQFSDFLPGGREYSLLMKLIEMYVPMHLEYDVDLILEPQEIPRLTWTLGRHPCRLGLGTMLNPARRKQLTVTIKTAGQL